MRGDHTSYDPDPLAERGLPKAGGVLFQDGELLRGVDQDVKGDAKVREAGKGSGPLDERLWQVIHDDEIDIAPRGCLLPGKGGSGSWRGECLGKRHTSNAKGAEFVIQRPWHQKTLVKKIIRH